MSKERKINCLLLYGISFAFIVLGFVGLFIYGSAMSETEHIYTFSGDTIGLEKDGISIDVNVSKSWTDEQFHPDCPVGAQYDYVIHNSSNMEFSSWKATIIYSQDMTVDSSWNGQFNMVGKTLHFTSDEDYSNLKKGNQSAFGAIMYSTQLSQVKSCIVSGYMQVVITEMIAFKVMCLLAIVWLVAIIFQIHISVRTITFERRQKRDQAIIRQSIKTFIEFIDAKDSYTRGHSSRVAEYALEIARRMKMSNEDTEQLYYITLMHDCGKIGVPDSVLNKPGKLTDEEFAQIKSHTTVGDHILCNFTAIPGIREGAHYHHERYDGNGYPERLKGKDIPLDARIICVCDSYDAMSTDRCYRKCLEEDEILGELANNAGTQFDPTIVRIMIDMIKDGTTDRIRGKYTRAS